MKYIKTYESLSQPKRYMLAHNTLDGDIFYILELDEEISDLFINTKKLYLYDKGSDNLVKKKHQHYTINKFIFDERIIYQSDILQEVLDVLPTLKDIDKYNL